MIYKLKESVDFRLNLSYVVAQGLYWMIVCCTVSLGSAYLTNRGYTTVGIGTLFAISYLLATVLQQVVSTATDSSTELNVLDVLGCIGALLVLDLIFACASNGKSFATAFTFLMGAMLATLMQPFLNALNFHIQKYQIKMNFGVARASGSFFFFVMSLVAGNLMKAVSEKAAPFLGLIATLLFVATIFWIFIELRNTGRDITDDYDPFLATTNDNSFDAEGIREFIIKYKLFFIYLIGLVGYLFGHLLINNFLFQISVNVGGDEASVGGLLAWQAIVELPAMIFFNWLKDRFGSKNLLILSAVFYVIKIFAAAVSTSVGMLYICMTFQALSFAVFIPASVHFVDEIMNEKDAVKGQAFITIAMTVGNLFSSLLGGIIIRLMGVVASLWVGTFITLVGAIISIYSLINFTVKK